jgi:hypothetical protein
VGGYQHRDPSSDLPHHVSEHRGLVRVEAGRGPVGAPCWAPDAVARAGRSLATCP